MFESKREIVLLLLLLLTTALILSCSSSTEPEYNTIKIDDLHLVLGKPSSAVISWTIPRGTGSFVPVGYELRYDTIPFSNYEDWKAARVVSDIPAPSSDSITQTYILEGLESGRIYYAGMRVVGFGETLSDISNLIVFSTGDTLSFYHFEAPDLNGNLVSTNDFLGNKLLVINFWGVWCSWCRVEMPDLIQLHDLYSDSGVVFVGYNYGDNPETALNYSNTVEIPWVNVQVTSTICINNNVRGFPTTLFFDSSGVELGRLRGSQSFDVFEEAVRYLLH